jgi:hypothetical protein
MHCQMLEFRTGYLVLGIFHQKEILPFDILSESFLIEQLRLCVLVSLNELYLAFITDVDGLLDLFFNGISIVLENIRAKYQIPRDAAAG